MLESDDESEIIKKTISNKVDVLHVRLTELHAAHQNLRCYLLTA